MYALLWKACVIFSVNEPLVLNQKSSYKFLVIFGNEHRDLTVEIFFEIGGSGGFRMRIMATEGSTFNRRIKQYHRGKQQQFPLGTSDL